MKKTLILLLPLTTMIFSGCYVNRLNQLVNESTESIHCNVQAVNMSTDAINRNKQLINESTKSLEENKRSLEAIGG